LTDYAAEIDQIVGQTEWNGKPLLSGSAGWGANNLYFLVDADGGSVGFNFSTSAGGSAGFITSVLTTLNGGLTGASSAVSDSAMAKAFNDVIEDALNKVRRGVMDIGSFTARMQFKEETLKIQYVNTEAAYNRIMNANMAEEQVEASKFSILQQTATAMLAQANVAPQFILSLFQ
jgi:flagellin